MVPSVPWWSVLLGLLLVDATTSAFPSQGPFFFHSTQLQRCRGGGGGSGGGGKKGDAMTRLPPPAAATISISESRPGSTNEDEKGRVFYAVDTSTGRLTALPPRNNNNNAAAAPVTSPSAAPPGDDEGNTVATAATAATATTAAGPSIAKLKHSMGRTKRKLKSFLQTVFLPVGFPGSVAPEYLRYQQWNVVQDLSTYLRGILATQAILEGVGVGREGATPLAATLQWITRDGASMMSGLVFTTLSSRNFGVNAKSWRLFADFAVDVGITLEMLAPLYPQWFLLCICLASVCKSLCGIAAGASNGAIVEHMAKTNNLAEVLAKGGAQHTAVSLFGLGFGMWFARVANQSPRRVWAAHVFLTVVHLVANWAAMRVLAFTSINRRRLEVLLAAFGTGQGVAAPGQVAGREAILLDTSRWLLPFRREKAGVPWKVRLGVRVNDVAVSVDSLRHLQEVFRGEAYLLNVLDEKEPLVVVALREDATNVTLLKAYFHAHLLQQQRQRRDGETGGEAPASPLAAIQASYEETCSLFPSFEEGLRSQRWNLDRVLLLPEGWVYHQDPK